MTPIESVSSHNGLLTIYFGGPGNTHYDDPVLVRVTRLLCAQGYTERGFESRERTLTFNAPSRTTPIDLNGLKALHGKYAGKSPMLAFEAPTVHIARNSNLPLNNPREVDAARELSIVIRVRSRNDLTLLRRDCEPIEKINGIVAAYYQDNQSISVVWHTANRDPWSLVSDMRDKITKAIL